jgi:hypothetical protein
MKNTSTLLLVALCMLAFNFTTQARISGTVFHDFNGNGIKENTATFHKTFVANVTVKGFNSNNVQIGGTKTTDGSGEYNFKAVEILFRNRSFYRILWFSKFQCN